MSECANIPVALLNDKRLSLSDVKVYAALSLLADESRRCSPTRNEIQEASGVQRVSRYTQNLSRYRYIRIEKAGDGNRNAYAVLFGDEVNRPQEITLEGFKKEFLEYSSGVHSKNTVKVNYWAFMEFIKIVGNRPLHSISIREIEHFLSVKKKEATEWTARKHYGSLASAFEKAVQWDLIKVNPFRKVKKPKPPEVLPLFFSEDEFNTLMGCVQSRDFRELCITALLSGLRLGELLSLRWNDIDFTSKVILVKNSESFTTKSRMNRTVPMSEELFRLLGERKGNIRKESAFVFHNERGEPLKPQTVSQQFKKYVRRAGLNDKLHFHSLRHSFATHLAKKSVPLFAIQKLLGHSTSKTTEIYSHLLPQQLHREVNVLAGLFNLKNENTN